ncbi:MAG: adenylosuccinate synthase [Firmicutes bacterium]|nr:adenylosuccinate synthase [Bacillota bacterium]
MNTLSIVGLQFGDEGKGKITDSLSHQFDYVVRYQGGHNAGHTVYANGQKYVLHVLPTGIVHPHTINVLGTGMVISLDALQKELQGFNVSQLRISDRAHLLFPFHQQLDAQSEQTTTQKIGTTQKGIGPAYQTKTSRIGIRVGSLKDLSRLKLELKQLVSSLGVTFDGDAYVEQMKEFIAKIVPFITDTSYEIYQAYQQKKRILFEGAQGVMLDLDHGTYPYVTSSHPTPSSIPVDIGLPPSYIQEALGIVKAYTTRVGEGPFPTEIFGEEAEKIRKTGNEYGSTTGRPRRIGHLDAVMLQHAIRMTGVNQIAITLLDVLSMVDTIKICVAYELNGQRTQLVPSHASDVAKLKPIYETLPGWKVPIQDCKSFMELPKEAKTYLHRIQSLLGVPIRFISNGPKREQLIERTHHHD